MEKNYYDILEINKNASPEIIEKAYKVLVRKYHPDLQENELKQEYEEKLKLINEAYDVLSNEEKRKQYNLELEQSELLNQQKSNINYENSQMYQDETNNNQNSQSTAPNYNEQINNNINYDVEQARMQAEQQKKYEQEYNRQINDAINRAYHDAYIQDLKNRGYKIRYKKTFKDYINNLITFIIFIFIFILLWQIPFVKNYFVDLYNENIIIKYVVDLFLNLFQFNN